VISIFYDLETTDRYNIGQILNYSFIAVDQNFKPLSDLSGLVSVSRLQLPSPGAILTNRVNLSRHQQEAKDSELEAMLRISGFLEGLLRKYGSREKLVLIGFNSQRFDLGFLRTSLIRNGIEAYFKGGFLYRDILLAAKKLFATNSEFRNIIQSKNEKLSLSLESLAHKFELIKGEQTHNSREDVLLTIELAKLFSKRFSFNPCIDTVYDVPGVSPQSLRQLSLPVLSINYQDPQHSVTTTAWALLDQDNRYDLWIDLDQFDQTPDRRALRWINRNGAAVIVDSKLELEHYSKQHAARREAAQKALEKINLRNYFKTSNCDIEQDIYRLDFEAQRIMNLAVHQGQKSEMNKTKNKDLKEIYMRYRLRSFKPGVGDEARAMQELKRYGLYRYSGKLKLNKFDANEESEFEAGSDAEFAPHLKQIVEELSLAKRSGTEDDKELLEALESFYQRSDLYKLISPELLNLDDSGLELKPSASAA